MMRPLYIDGVSGCRVIWDDPALRIIVPDRADQLFLLSRISRVVCQGGVEWSMQALLACADAGIQLLFLEKNGAIRARWLGQSGERQRLTQRLIDLLSRTDGPAHMQTGCCRWKNWRSAVVRGEWVCATGANVLRWNCTGRSGKHWIIMAGIVQR
ncbi:MAG: CRISPR-associated endonuclease Cas1 [Nitrosomonas sp.]|nr:CRISPR-associated endonuclease Cas1 [Nitrosomonas sp.]MCW5606975.1 CRISPR-associated endonuclease Cas1 [Nitrosomonas sp.]